MASSINITKIYPEIDICLPFPPSITAQELLSNECKLQTSNCFIIYRKVLSKELKLKHGPKYNRSKVSSLASQLWKKEPDNVKRRYKKLAAELKSLNDQRIRSQGLFYKNSKDHYLSQNLTNNTIANNLHQNGFSITQNSSPYLQQLQQLQQIQQLQLQQRYITSTSLSSDMIQPFVSSDVQSNFGNIILVPSQPLHQVNSTLTLEQLQSLELYNSENLPCDNNINNMFNSMGL